jgi:hypothetical protein
MTVCELEHFIEGGPPFLAGPSDTRTVRFFGELLQIF